MIGMFLGGATGSSLSDPASTKQNWDIARMVADRANWPVLAQLIKSEWVPSDRMAEIARDYPEFWSACVDGDRPSPDGGAPKNCDGDA